MNPEHMEIVRQGGDAINAWRNAHPTLRLDLSGADLPLAKLAEVDLSKANLSKSNLVEADLSGTLLYGADLSHSNISGARLVQTDLFRANLANAILSDANLSAAILSQANLSGADLSASQCYVTDLSEAVLSNSNLSYADLDRANLDRTLFSCAILNKTVFADCDLSRSLGLATLQHQGPSTLGLDTLVRSRGQLPPTFLRGAGVPDELVNYFLEQPKAAQPFYTCFINHVSADQEFARGLSTDLQSRGVRCWSCEDDFPLGRRVGRKTDQTIRVYDKLLVICSVNSLRNDRVLRELERALLKEQFIARSNHQAQNENGNGLGHSHLREPQVLFLARLDNYVFEGWQHPRKAEVVRRSIGDFTGWSQSAGEYKKSLCTLLRALNDSSWPAEG